MVSRCGKPRFLCADLAVCGAILSDFRGGVDRKLVS
jgi:hypothetical protein